MLPVNDFICVKLGKLTTTGGQELDGEETIRIYEQYLWGHSDVWFSTDSLPTGMAEKQARHYRRLIENGEVRILFAYNDGLRNDIQYSANIGNPLLSGDIRGS